MFFFAPLLYFLRIQSAFSMERNILPLALSGSSLKYLQSRSVRERPPLEWAKGRPWESAPYLLPLQLPHSKAMTVILESPKQQNSISCNGEEWLCCRSRRLERDETKKQTNKGEFEGRCPFNLQSYPTSRIAEPLKRNASSALDVLHPFLVYLWHILILWKQRFRRISWERLTQGQSKPKQSYSSWSPLISVGLFVVV